MNPALDTLLRLSRSYKPIMGRALARVALSDRGRAQEYAKRSPALTQATKRKRRVTSKKTKNRPTPGTLEKSITTRQRGADWADVFVPINSSAHEYARIQHDVLEGRGIGTREKGADAGWKYIERAVMDPDRVAYTRAEFAKAVDAIIRSGI